MKKFYLLLMMCMSVAAWASTPSTEGMEFWLTFMNNEETPVGSSEVEFKLIASSRYETAIKVSNPQTNWSQTFSVKAGEIAELVLPHEQCYTFSKETVEKKGLIITSSMPISLYASNFREHTYDATIVLPSNALGNQYIVQAFENVLGGMYGRECAVVATENNTTVTITPHARTTGGKMKSVPFQITLNRGETYQIVSLDENADFSGTRVESNKNIAVFSGHQCINVPTGNPWCDHVVEQQMPTQMWGWQFAVTKTKGQNGDMVMVTASEDNTIVKLNGTQAAKLNASESYEFRLTDESGFIETSQPTAVFQYLEGARRNNMIGDPSSVHISPIEQQIKELTFATFQTNVSRTHYVNIVTTAAGAAAMTLDGEPIASEFQTLKGNSAFRFAQIHLQHGTHTLKTAKDGFVGHVYGLGDCESYAYTFGSATLALNGQILVNGEPRINVNYSDNRCYKQDITFSVNSNTKYNYIEWDLGDGTKSTQSTVKHTYTQAGDYNITMILTNEDGRDTARTSLHLVEILRDTVYATICDNEKYVINGTEYNTNGTFNQTLQSVDGCDSIVTLILTVNNTHTVNENASIPLGSSYRWHWKWYNEAGEYRDTLLSSHGCDSICIMTLETVDQTETIYDTICYQPTYTFMGESFSIPSVAGEKDAYVDFVLELRDFDECSAKQVILAVSTLAGGNYEIFDTIQQGMTYEFYGQSLTTPGTYTATASSGRGCEQNYTLHLTVLSYPIIETEMAFCHEDKVTWRGQEYTKTGVYNDTVFIPAGIKEVHRLTLTDGRSRTEISVNTSEPYTLNGQTYSESGTYTQTKTNAAGCDSLIILHLGINEKCVIKIEESMQICEGSSITWNGQTCNEARDYTWQGTSKDGCDSIVTLHLSLAPVYNTVIPVQICSGDFYRYNGDRLSTEGDHSYTFKSVDGCDSIVTINISYIESYHSAETQTLFPGQSVTWQGNTYSAAGDYSVGFIAKNGCDSILTLHLVAGEKEIRKRDYEVNICTGVPYDFYGDMKTVPGTYTHTSHYTEYDSIITVTIHVGPVFMLDEYATINKGQEYDWNGEIYTIEGEYLYKGHTAFGCDSIVTLHLTVTDKEIRTRSYEASICEGGVYDFYGETLTEANTYSTTVNYADYDSIINLKLVVNQRYDLDEYETIVDGQLIEWNGQTYSAAGEYMYEGKTVAGCDSIVTLHLTVEGKETRTREFEASICEGDSYEFYGQQLDAANTYSTTINYAEYDSIITVVLTVSPSYHLDEYAAILQGESIEWNGKTYSAAGEYQYKDQSVAGCDSIVTLHLTIGERPVVNRTENVKICEGSSYQFYGTVYTTQGRYEHLSTGEKADTLVTLNLTVVRIKPTYIDVELQVGETYVYNYKTYSTSGDYEVHLKSVDGCDSLVVLRITEAQSMRINNCELDIANSCADERAIVLHLTCDNTPDSIRVRFSGRDNAAGLPDVTITNVSDYMTINHEARAGKYKANLQLYKKHKVVYTAQTDFTLLYPSSVLEQAWNDVIIVLAHNYNGGYDFKRFEWYKDGNLLFGEDGSYIYQPLEMGASYSARLTETNGIQIMTCPIIAEPQEDLYLYPTSLYHGDKIKCHTTGKAQMYVYDATGKLVMQQMVDVGNSDYSLPEQPGIYYVRLQLIESGKDRSYKVIVN